MTAGLVPAACLAVVLAASVASPASAAGPASAGSSSTAAVATVAGAGTTPLAADANLAGWTRFPVVSSRLAGACTDDTGVTVVVDFPGAGNVDTRCAGWPVSSGFDALEKAGFSVTPVQQQPQFVCRIDGVPAEDKCVVTPPGTAFWAYWTAERGGSWRFSDEGAGSSQPEAGSVEGWAFGAGGAPSIPPPDEPAPPPPPPPPPSTPAPPATSELPPGDDAETPGGDGGDPTSDPADDAEAGPSTGAPTALPSTATPTATTSATTTAARSTGAATTATPDSDTAGPTTVADPSSGGTPVGTLAGVGLVLALAGGAGVTALRRRRAAAE